MGDELIPRMLEKQEYVLLRDYYLLQTICYSSIWSHSFFTPSFGKVSFVHARLALSKPNNTSHDSTLPNSNENSHTSNSIPLLKIALFVFTVITETN